MTIDVNVTSEIGALRHVIVHPPGRELLAVTPSNRREYLYDDIIDHDLSLEEHRRFTSLLWHFAQVHTVQELLAETLKNPEARDFLVTLSEEVTANRKLRSQLGEYSIDELVERYVEGWRLPAGALAERLEAQSYVLPPLPNLFFTRDASLVIGKHVIVSAMRFLSRWPEEVLMRTIFGFHPELGRPPILYDGSDERRHDYMLEGGDIHPLSPTVVVMGVSERSSVATLDELALALFESTDTTDAIVVVLPDRSTAIHLDMVWTQVDRQLCVAYPPLFRGPTRAPVLHLQKGRSTVSEPSTMFHALRDVGLPMEPIWAGGDSKEGREREQWASACNFLAVAPGQVISYARNLGTLEAMGQAGFRIVEGEALLLGDEQVEPSDRVVMTFHGSELVRGGGGPRCMSCPIERQPLG